MINLSGGINFPNEMIFKNHFHDNENFPQILAPPPLIVNNNDLFKFLQLP